jgi:hypothetical protein
LLIFTLAYLFVVCALGDFSFGGLVGRVLFAITIVAGGTDNVPTSLGPFLGHRNGGGRLTLTWMEQIHREWSLTILCAILGMLFLVLPLGGS